MSNNYSRRDVLRGGVAATVGLGLGLTEAAQAQKPMEPGQKLRVGIIGCGGKGWSGREQAVAAGAEVVAVCDVDLEDRIKAQREHMKAAAFDDYREMIASMRGKMDAVIISTPDHHHAPATVLALHAGMHTYTEKPLCRTIWEARQLAILAKKKKAITQMGNNSTQSTQMRKVAKLLREGTWGKVKEIHLWTDRAKVYWEQGIPRPASKPVPKGLDWDMWVGPRPMRDYADGYHHFSWRGFWDFGTGALGDMGCHIFNMPHMALGLDAPLAVQAKTSGHNKESFPTWAHVTYEYGAKGKMDPFKLHWYDGGQKPPQELAELFTFGGNGVIVVCEKDTIFGADESNTRFSLVSGNPIPDTEVVQSPGHMKEWVNACLSGTQAVSNFPGYSGPLTEAVLLGNLAIWADGPRLEWDSKNMKVKGTNEFDSLIKPEFRPGFSVKV
jgi:predicted dehydrogenase